MKQLRRVVLPLLTVALLVSSFSSFAQAPFSQTPEPRIKGPLTEASSAVLSNSRTPRVRDAEDLGPVSSETLIPGITLVFKRSASQEATLQELLSAQQNASSPLYHQWLTPETFATRFGIADQDIAATQSWLTSRGFHIDSVSRSRDRITFSGTAAQVQAAFGTELHRYRAQGELHFSPAADLTLPADLASVTAAVLHLSDFRPRPNVKVQTRPRPDYTTLSTQTHYLGPKDIYTMYDMTSFFTNQELGGGQGLAVVGQSYVDTSTSSIIRQFESVMGGNGFSPVLVPGSGVEAISPGDQGESEIDIEYSTGIASNANIFFVYVGNNQNYDVFDALGFAIDQDIAPVVSISYGICESLMSVTDMDGGNALFEQAAAQGQTIVASAGDSGSTACAGYTTSEGVPLATQQALSVLYPASSPYVTAVGGTQMAAGTFTAGSSQYWASASLHDAVGSLLSYVPEVAWNEDSTSFGIAAGGGGASSHFTRPTWQSGVPGIPSGSFRLLPDIALQASIENPGFLICSDDLSLIGSEGQTSSCGDGLVGSNNKYTVAGGTSFAAPIFAGLITILNQAKHTTGQGNVNPTLYSLASNPKSYASAFHDIISGSNACIPVVSNCATPGESGYAATPGYDQATGLGSVDFNNLVAAWPSTSTNSLTPTSVLIIGSQYTANPGDIVPVQIVVTSSYANAVPPAPTGALSVSLDGVVAQSSLAITSTNPLYSQASVNYSYVAPPTAGAHLLTVTYPGDATHSASTATFSVLVGNVTATGSFSVTAGNLTVANGSTGSTQIAATPSGGYTGKVAWSLAAATTNGTAEVCYSISPSSSNNLNAATLTIFVGSACNSVAPAERSNLRPINSRAASKQQTPSPWRKTPQIALYAGLILCGSLAGRRRKIRLSLLLALASLTCITTVLTGCGGGGGSKPGTPPAVTPNATTYTLTLTGKDSVNSSITASTTFTLTVN
ncbi:S53 family peptidase [Tunturibacter empetritectus]|uniref:Subtilase family serine protease n=1 Tax=Tunturiibacter lichenicola TaxID=2051959 RepID=A0A7W8J9U4_9BACT|nr:S53 family peptidase [Edaphobacter lichenicola]MBB5343992.1 subtilase family serine protease [Edaphobacter lichenicola]